MTVSTKKMTKSVSAVEARTRLGQLLDETENGEHYFIIERRGRPVAAILSIDAFEDYLDLRYEDHPVIKEVLIESQKDYEAGRVSSLGKLYQSMKPLKETVSKP